MEHLRWAFRPDLDDPVMIAAFEGWNDAGEAASGSVAWFADRWEATPFAEIDAEEFFDFTETRPHVRLEDGNRVIDWPNIRFSAATIPGTNRDVILVEGSEPQFRWRTLCDHVFGVASELGASLFVTMGALLAEVPHSRPVKVVGTAQDDDVIQRLALQPSRYEGPTGIVGVLHSRARITDLESASLWATVPSYVPGAQSPKATMALVQRLASLLDVPVATIDLEIAAASYERQIDELLEDDEDTQRYVRLLEERFDDQLQAAASSTAPEVPDDPEAFVEAVEQFLRELGD